MRSHGVTPGVALPDPRGPNRSKWHVEPKPLRVDELGVNKSTGDLNAAVETDPKTGAWIGFDLPHQAGAELFFKVRGHLVRFQVPLNANFGNMRAQLEKAIDGQLNNGARIRARWYRIDLKSSNHGTRFHFQVLGFPPTMRHYLKK